LQRLHAARVKHLTLPALDLASRDEEELFDAVVGYIENQQSWRQTQGEEELRFERRFPLASC